ncbi:4466_t:CDS:2, partial [Dentiscutata heterogama]
AKAYTNKFFTAGISSTSRVKSKNAVIKNIIQGRPSLCELAAILNLRLSDEIRYIKHNEWYYANTSAQLRSASAECFPEIDHILKEYLTEEMLFRQRHKITQSLYYYTITKNEELPNDSYAKESYDTQQIHLTSFLKNLSSNEIAIQSAVEAGSESLCHLKRSLNNWFAEEKRLTQINNNKENLDPDQVENPIEKRHRGRSSVKSIKSSTKQ